MQTKEKPYVGELIRKYIKEKRLTNGYINQILSDAGIFLSEPKFSNKIYGVKSLFTDEEVSAINKELGTDFK